MNNHYHVSVDEFNNYSINYFLNKYIIIYRRKMKITKSPLPKNNHEDTFQNK